MKHHKMKTLVSAVALVSLAASGSVFAAFTGTQGNSSVLFNAYESVSGYSFALDTGLRKNDITSAFTGTSFNLGTDTNWTSFLSHVGSGHLSDIKWNVIAGDTTVGDGDPVSYLSTGPASGVPNGTTNSQLNSWGGNLNSFITASGNVNAAGFEGGNSTLHLKTGSADYASFEFAEGPNWNTKANFNTTGGLGDSLSLYDINKNGTANLNKVNATLLGSVTLSDTGALAIAPVSPIPEPDTWAMLLAGLSLLGAMARRRSGALARI
jgi:hypothetical protein